MEKRATERLLQTRAGIGVFCRHWPAAGSAAIVAGHGNGSHSGAYAAMATHLTRADLYVPDLRGYGASPVRPAEVTSWQGWVDDMVAVAAEAAGTGKRVLLFGHSLGSLVALAAAPRVPGLAGVILSAPSPSSKAMTQEWIGGALALFHTQGPQAEIRLPWGPGQLVRSSEVRAEIAADPLALRPVTTGMLLQIVELVAAAEQAAGSVKAPALMLLPGDDQLVERSESIRQFGWLGGTDKHTVEFPGCYHELPQEAPELVGKAIDNWLEAVLD